MRNATPISAASHSVKISATLLGTTCSDAEYQSFRQEQVLRETLAKTEAVLEGVFVFI